MRNHVQRNDLLDQIITEDEGRFWDVRGADGAGKSVLLGQVEQRIATEGGRVITIDILDHFTGFEKDKLSTPKPQAEAQRFGRMLASVVGNLDVDQSEVLEIADKADQLVCAGGAESWSDETVNDHVTKLLADITELLNRLIDMRRAQLGRTFLLIDSFDSVDGHPMGAWILELARQLRGVTVVVARRTGRQVTELPGATGVLSVESLTPQQVTDYLRVRVGSKLAPLVAGEVLKYSGGRALIIALLADLICDRNRAEKSAMTAEEWADKLDGWGRLDSDLDVRLTRLVEELIDEAERESVWLTDGLHYLWLLRRFDNSLLQYLLGAAHDERETSRMAERLVEYSFVQERIPPGRPDDLYYTVHDSVRTIGQSKLRDRDRLVKLHRRIETFYEKETTRFLDDYEGWFRYEDPRWQALIREWLYHIAQLKLAKSAYSQDTDQDSEPRVNLAKLFFDAFWWWGNYVPFRFCEQLLADWIEMSEFSKVKGRQQDLDAALGRTLLKVYELYPKRWRRDTTEECWRALNDQLVSLLPMSSKDFRDLTQPKVRHVVAIIDIYRAEAIRFLKPDDPRVVELLEESLRLFGDNNDIWEASWLAFQIADAALGRKDPEAAVEACMTQVPNLADLDAELVANLHRVYADVAWLDGRFDDAFDCYARAALHAYHFQIAQGDPTDEYTQEFLTEMHERTQERIAWLKERGEDELIAQAYTRIRDFFAPYWERMPAPEATTVPDAPAAIVKRMFPPPPAGADLHYAGTVYTTTVAGVCDAMQEEFAMPPGRALPREREVN